MPEYVAAKVDRATTLDKRYRASAAHQSMTVYLEDWEQAHAILGRRIELLRRIRDERQATKESRAVARGERVVSDPVDVETIRCRVRTNPLWAAADMGPVLVDLEATRARLAQATEALRTAKAHEAATVARANDATRALVEVWPFLLDAEAALLATCQGRTDVWPLSDAIEKAMEAVSPFLEAWTDVFTHEDKPSALRPLPAPVVPPEEPTP